MSREIKFRGQMSTGEWVYGLPHHDLPGSTAYYKEFSYRICWHIERGGAGNAPIKNGTLGQFTGLEDKNGKEIYEGDILESPSTHKGVVVFENSTWGIKPSIEHEGSLNPFSNMHTEYWEIIGNIYEKIN